MNYRKISNSELSKFKYPNVAAELIESRCSICTLADHMGLGRRKEDDPEIWAKLRGEKEITAQEALAISRLFRADFKYLFSTELQVFSGKTMAYWR